MIWTTWRTNRTLYIGCLVLAASLASWLIVTGSRQESAWNALSTLHCRESGSNTGCLGAASRYLSASQFSTAGVMIGIALPAVLGLVLGTPLVAGEYSQRTNRLGWTQSITRSKWFGQKLIVSGSIAIVIAGALVPALTWWTSLVQRPRMASLNFDVSGIVPVAYTIFAFSVGVYLGTLVKKSGWAFAVGVLAFAIVRFLERTFLRVHLAPTVFLNGPTPAPADSWVVHEGYVPLSRSTPTPGLNWQSASDAVNRCAARAGGIQAHSYSYCVKMLKLHWVYEIQPAGHFWALQIAESGVFVTVSATLIALSLLAVRHSST